MQKYKLDKMNANGSCQAGATSGPNLEVARAAREEGQATSSPSPAMPTTVQGRLARADALRVVGNQFFKKQEWRKAIQKYHQAKMFCKGIADTPDFIPRLELAAGRLKPTEEEKKEVTDIMVTVTNNLAGDLPTTCNFVW